MSLQNKFDSLRQVRDDPMWVDAKNAWIRTLPPVACGKIGEELARMVFGGAIEANNRNGYDIVVQRKKIEVKVACLAMANDYPMLTWRQIRPADPYTHICFVAIYPNNVRIFLVPKGEIPRAAMTHMHGRGKTLNIFVIRTRKIDELFVWMARREILIP